MGEAPAGFPFTGLTERQADPRGNGVDGATDQIIVVDLSLPPNQAQTEPSSRSSKRRRRSRGGHQLSQRLGGALPSGDHAEVMAVQLIAQFAGVQRLASQESLDQPLAALLGGGGAMGRLARVLLGNGGEHPVEKGRLLAQQAFGEPRRNRPAVLQPLHEEVAEEGMASKAATHNGIHPDSVASGKTSLGEDGWRRPGEVPLAMLHASKEIRKGG